MQTLTHYRPENAKHQVLIRRSDFLATPTCHAKAPLSGTKASDL